MYVFVWIYKRGRNKRGGCKQTVLAHVSSASSISKYSCLVLWHFKYLMHQSQSNKQLWCHWRKPKFPNRLALVRILLTTLYFFHNSVQWQVIAVRVKGSVLRPAANSTHTTNSLYLQAPCFISCTPWQSQRNHVSSKKLCTTSACSTTSVTSLNRPVTYRSWWWS